VKEVRKIFYGAVFKVVTDNDPLTYVTSSAKLDATKHRWLAALSNYTFKTTYRLGKNNVDADGLSRIPQSQSDEKTINEKVISAMS
jgi:hypothetical protein